ncbi:MAG: DUF2155 domain-containing protein [Pseudomonadota bacterium]
MMRLHRLVGAALVAVALSSTAHGQEGAPITALPFSAPDSTPRRITPEQKNAADAAILTTHDVPAAPEGEGGAKLPWQKPVAPTIDIAPVQAAPAAATTATPFGNYQPKVPFGRGESSGPAIPSGPHNAQAVPVVGVDAVEASEAQPPTPVPPAADPAKEDPAEPTELTSPIFDAATPDSAPRKVVIRALNKVTAQSELMEIKPGDVIKFGRLEITAVTCRASSPTSQTDYAGLLDISEHLPDKNGLKPLFRGWMYASSPSIAALEHPVYDVTMVECKQAAVAPKAEEKADKPAVKKAKK